MRVLCRPRRHPPAAGDVLEYLKVLPGADRHLTVVSGDVTDAAALQAAMAQCQQLVHLAGVVDVLPPRHEQQRQQMVSTALEGTRMVLDAATAAGSIRKVILASSIVAVMADWWERGSEHVYTEQDWALDGSVEHSCYAYCKRESEKLAYQIAEGKSWELATICPGIVFGPVATPKLAESASVWTPIVQHMNGVKYPWTSNMFVTHVDVDDVAAATCGLLGTPGAAGRYLLMSGPAPSVPQITQLLSAAYPTAKVPYMTAYGWVVSLLARYNSHRLGFDIHKFRAMHNKPFKVDASKITDVLPDFQYISLEDSVKAAADSVVAMGLASFHTPLTAAASASCCLGLLRGLGSRLGQLAAAVRGPAAAAAASAIATVTRAAVLSQPEPAAAAAAAAAEAAAQPAAAEAVCDTQQQPSQQPLQQLQQQPQPQQQQKVLKDEAGEIDIKETAMLASALSGGLEGSHEVMAIVTSPVGSEAKLTRLPSAMTNAVTAGLQQL